MVSWSSEIGYTTIGSFRPDAASRSGLHSCLYSINVLVIFLPTTHSPRVFSSASSSSSSSSRSFVSTPVSLECHFIVSV
jgi:hypothetical protein